MIEAIEFFSIVYCVVGTMAAIAVILWKTEKRVEESEQVPWWEQDLD